MMKGGREAERERERRDQEWIQGFLTWATRLIGVPILRQEYENGEFWVKFIILFGHVMFVMPNRFPKQRYWINSYICEYEHGEEEGARFLRT